MASAPRFARLGPANDKGRGMEEKGKILYLSHDTRVAVHNAVFAGISRYAAMRG